MDIFKYFPGEPDKEISKLRIPISGGINVCDSVLEIIDTPEFQRLRGVRQLGPTIFVFPGANHTRFEHSLGVYNNALLYLDKLLTFDRFRLLIHPVDKNVRIIILSALLHDLGHYPYSHWVEEIEKFHDNKTLDKHEERSIKIIEHSKVLTRLITKDWDTKISDLAETIKATTDQGKQGLINSILSSIIDVDKVDYLRRDSIHCGVTYGNAIDIERLIDSLYIHESAEKNDKRICVTDKGASVLMNILSARITMYQEVYWHKTVRICDAMFKRFFFEYVRLSNLSQADWDEIAKSTDDELTIKLYNRSKEFGNDKLTKLIETFLYKGRKLYKLLYVHKKGNKRARREIRNFFDKVSKWGYSELVDSSNKLANELKIYYEAISELDILIEVTPVKPRKEDDHLAGFQLYNTKIKKYEDYPAQLDELNSYLKENQRSYIFCSKDAYEVLSEVDVTTLEEIIGKL